MQLDIDIDPLIVRAKVRVEEAREALRGAEEDLATRVLAMLNLPKGTLVEHTRNGLQYVVDRAYVTHAAFKGTRTTIGIMAYRYYHTGRRAGTRAASGTHLDLSSIERVANADA